MLIEHGRSEVPVPWPSGITTENRAAIERNLVENSLVGAVALFMVEEIKPLVQREFEIFRSGGGDLFGHSFRDWTAYLRAAHAVLNAESILKTGKPYQKPDHDFEAIKRNNRVSMKDFLIDENERRELKGQRSVAGQIGWLHRELRYVDRYKVTDSPLDFVDWVIREEAGRLREQDRKDMEIIQEMDKAVKEEFSDKADKQEEEVVEFIGDVASKETEKRIAAMEIGRLRLHELYQDFNH